MTHKEHSTNGHTQRFEILGLETGGETAQHTADPAAAPAPAQRDAMNVDQVAKRLGIGRTLVFDLVATGKLRSYRIGRRRLFDPADVERFWQSCMEQHPRSRPQE